MLAAVGKVNVCGSVYQLVLLANSVCNHQTSCSAVQLQASVIIQLHDTVLVQLTPSSLIHIRSKNV